MSAEKHVVVLERRTRITLQQQQRKPLINATELVDEYCLPDRDDIIDWAKYYSVFKYGNIFLAPTSSQLANKLLALLPSPSETAQDGIQNSNRNNQNYSSAIQDHDHCYASKRSNYSFIKCPKLDLINERKESPIYNRIPIISLLLLLLAASNWRPIHKNAVSCSDPVPGNLIYRNSHHLPYNHPTLRSTFRHLNIPQPSSVVPNIYNNNNQNHKPGLYHNHNPMMLADGGDSLNEMPSSAIESFYSDESSSSPSAQSTGAPIANGWSSMISSLNGGASPQASDSLDKHVKNILVPRVSGTPGNVKVRQYIVDSLEANDYTVQLDEFTDSTPVGKVKFANIIAYSNPSACRQLVLACHYDSKMMDGFLGAVDSAVPCAMLLKMSETFKTDFRQKDDQSSQRNSLGLQFIFFDGEEAYHQWGPTDSLYGSRHLAAKWEKQKAPEQCSSSSSSSSPSATNNELSRIELLVLLDLIGAKDTSFVMYTSYDPTVSRVIKSHHEQFRKHERAYLTSRNGLTGAQANREAAFRNRQMPIYMIEDDHVPFMKRGVPILSLLASPFPRVWHTTADNYDAIDFAKTRRIMHVLEQWLANYEDQRLKLATL